jgi:hypothetical protein
MLDPITRSALPGGDSSQSKLMFEEADSKFHCIQHYNERSKILNSALSFETNARLAWPVFPRNFGKMAPHPETVHSKNHSTFLEICSGISRKLFSKKPLFQRSCLFRNSSPFPGNLLTNFQKLYFS